MNEINIGKFIAELRKEKLMTQKELAERLGVTDKAVSKWERDLSYPDISLLSPLASIFDITTTELLQGEKSPIISKDTETTVKKAISYSKANAKWNLKRIKDIGAIVITGAFVLGAFTCLLCDLVITGTLTWSLLVVSSLIYAWIVLIPLLQSKSKPISISLLFLSIGLFPYIFFLGRILQEYTYQIHTLGSAIGLMSVIALWIMYAAVLKTYKRPFLAVALVCLIAIPLNAGIDMVILHFTNVNKFTDLWINVLTTALGAFSFFAFDYFYTKHKKKNEKFK